MRITREGAVAIVTLDDPASANALDGAMIAELRAALTHQEREARAIVLTGSGKAFCAGAKLTAENIPAGPEHDAGAPLEECFHPLIAQIADLAVPFVTAVNGVAAGGGMALSLAGDIIVASETARFVPAFAKIGLVPDCGVSRLLVDVVGRVRAAEILLLGETIDARRALALGLVNRLAAPGGLLDAALEIARGLADGPTIALGLTRRLLWRAPEGTLDDVLTRERIAQREAGRSADHAEAIDAFLGKRPPLFSGR